MGLFDRFKKEGRARFRLQSDVCNGGFSPRLEADDTEPKVIPRIFEVWESPERFRERIG